MPNYSLIANSTFQPFSYQELLAPVAEMSTYHEKLADEYDKLSSQADVLEALGKNDRDRGAYDRYKSYSDNLRQEADELYRHGLNAESRRRLSALRQRYNTDIVPIQNAWNKREEEAKAQQQALMQNPSIRFTRIASETPIDSYIDNPMGGYGVVNLDSITKDMSDAAKNLANQIRAGVTFEGLDPYTTRYIEHYGLDPNIINDWITNPSKMPILTQMMNDVLQKHGVTAEALAGSPNAASIVRESLGAAQRGAWSAIGADKSATFDNYAARQQAELDLYRRKKEIDAAAAAGTTPEYNVPGESFNINFNDAESAGAQMKTTLANATMNFLQNSKLRGAKAYLDKLSKEEGGLEGVLSRWQEQGIDGNELKENGLYYPLGNYLRDNVTKDEDLINIWRSSFAEKTKPAVTDQDNYNRNTYGGLDYTGTPINEDTYRSLRRPTASSTIPGVAAGTKDWRDFNKRSTNGYHVSAIQLNDDPTTLSEYLSRTLDRNVRNGRVNLYDIKKISGSGEYTYSDEGTKVSDLPKTSSGTVDYKQIHRALLSNGDYLLYWQDDKGNSVQKVLRRRDIGSQAMQDWERVDKQGYQGAFNLYSRGVITKEQFDEMLRGLGVTNLTNAYLDTQSVKVKEHELE